LGIHGCLDLARALRLGPDARAARDEHDLDVAGDEDAFFVAGQRLFPWLRREELFPGMAGIRPKLAGDGFHDFVLEEGTVDGLPGWLTLAGIESPGLTAALALAEEVEAALPAW
jgi:L-2-hydroxyglutarate oxidase LhgO